MVRNLWLSPHLLNSPDGAAAHRAAADLGAEVHGEILRVGDRLADSSAVLAQQYYQNAAATWRRLGGDGFSEWVGLGEGLAGTDPISREGASAFFSVRVAELGEEPLAKLAAWSGSAMRIAAESGKLAGLFLRHTAPLMSASISTASVDTWAAAGIGLYGQHGWQGEFLAQAFFNATARVMPALSPSAYRLWAGAGSALFPQVREREFFNAFPDAIGGWAPEDQANLMRVVIALAHSDRRLAHDVYRRFPDSLRPVAAAARGSLLRVLTTCGHKLGSSMGDFAPVAGAILRQVPAARLASNLAQVERVSRRAPQAVVSALRSLPRVCEDADDDRVEQWFTAGLRVAAENPGAGLAYFALESRTSVNVLHRGSTAASLEQSQGLLRKYLQMMSGSPVGIRPMERFSLRPDIEEFPGEREVSLPSRIDLLPSHEENLRLYRLLAAHLAGRRLLGTYATQDLPVDPTDPPGRALFRYLTDDARPALLEDLFTLAEGVRVHCAMSRLYRGIASEANWVADRLLRIWCEQPAAARSRRLDTLFILALVDGETEHWPRWLDREIGTTLLALLRPLRGDGTTVIDALRAAEAIAAALDNAATGIGGDLSEADGSFYDTVAGEMIYYDLYEDEDGMPPPNTDGGAETPAAEQSPVTPRDLQLEVSDEASDDGGGTPLSPDEIERLLQSGADLRIRQGGSEEGVEGLGLYVTDLIGKMPSEHLDELRRLLGDPEEQKRRPPRRWLERSSDGTCYWYDEWDYQISDYRSRWCQLYEIGLDGDSGEFFQTALGDHADLLPEVRRQFQRIRPEMYRTVRGLEDGEDFDLNAAVSARIDARAGIAPSNRLYVARKREERDVATLFLVDMSASTDEPLVEPAADGRRRDGRPPRRIIDVTKETLAIMSQALEEIGDAFAIYGFSGHGREQVEMYRVKSFAEALTPSVKARLGAIEPRRSTRMGTALRHAVERMASVSARSKHLILLSDGFPQDFDYGQDRRSNLYGIRDTAVALQEAELAGVTPFCITVDKAGHDYLREMCDENRYMVIDDITALPRELPKIYQRVVRS